MKLNMTRNANRVTLFATTLLATCLFTGVLNAQPGFRGKFTLQHETRWVGAVLPPGEYVLALAQGTGTGSTMVVIRDAKSGNVVAYVPPGIADGGGKGESALLISNRGGQRVVHSLRVAALGEVFIYDPALARERAAEEARNEDAVPVTAARK